MSEWIDCFEQMPSEKDEGASVGVLCWLAIDMVVSGWFSYSDNEWYDFNGDMIDEVYYWQPMPANPS